MSFSFSDFVPSSSFSSSFAGGSSSSEGFNVVVVVVAVVVVVDAFSPKKYNKYSLPLPVVVGSKPAPFLGLGPGASGFVGNGKVVHSFFELVMPTSPSPLASV